MKWIALVTTDKYRSDFDTTVQLFRTEAALLASLRQTVERAIAAEDVGYEYAAPPLDDLGALLDWIPEHLPFRATAVADVEVPMTVPHVEVPPMTVPHVERYGLPLPTVIADDPRLCEVTENNYPLRSFVVDGSRRRFVLLVADQTNYQGGDPRFQVLDSDTDEYVVESNDDAAGMVDALISREQNGRE